MRERLVVGGCISHGTSTIEDCIGLYHESASGDLSYEVAGSAQSQGELDIDLTIDLAHDLGILALDVSLNQPLLAYHQFARAFYISLDDTIDTHVAVGDDGTNNFAS
jgi:hypothetical protein